jgi:hypothetical protein
MGSDSATDVERKGWRVFPWQLPVLTGWPRVFFISLWSAIFAAACFASAMGVPLQWGGIADSSPFMRAGVVLTDDLGVVPASDEARAAGIARGDRLATIDGAPVADDPQAVGRLLDGPSGSKVRIGTRGPDGAVREHVLTRSEDNVAAAARQAGLSRAAYYGLSYAIADVGLTFVPLLCAALLMFRRSRDPLAPWAAMMMTVFVFGNWGAAVIWIDQWPAGVVIAQYCNFLCFSMLVGVLAIFPAARFENAWVALFIVVQILEHFLTIDLDTRFGNLILETEIALAVGFIVWRYRRMEPGPGRQQIRWVALGFAASLVALALLIMFQFMVASAPDYATYLWGRLGATLFATLLSLLLMIGITLGLLRYRLYDADAAISRSVAYGTLTIALLAIFGGTERVIEVLGEEYFGESLGALAAGLGAAVAVVMIAPLHHRLSHWAERHFQHGLTRLRIGLPRLLADLRETNGVAAISEAALDGVGTAVRSSRAALLLGDELAAVRAAGADEVAAWRDGWTPSPAEGLDCARRDALFPMRVPLDAEGHGRVGWLLLGPRPDGSFYGGDEREALEEIADPIARALAIAEAREQRDAERTREGNALQRELARLGERLAAIEGLVAPPARLA